MFNSRFVINVNFNCEECDEEISEKISLPGPNYMEYEDGGEEFDSESIYCESCDKEHVVNTFCRYSQDHFSVELDGVEISDGSPYFDEEITDELAWAIHNNDHHNIIISQLNNSQSLNQIQQELNGLEDTLNIMNYAHIVAAIEGYLGAVFIRYVMTYDQLFQNFIINNKDYNDVKFTASELVMNPEVIKSHVKEYLDKFIFHKVSKVKPLFKAVLNHDLGDISWLAIAVQIRHDCVHRAGITQSGTKLEITKQDINDLIKNGRELSENLKISLEKLEKK